MKNTLVFMKIAIIVKNIFDKKTGPELQAIKDHFAASFSDAQLCALVVVGMIIRIFGLAPPQKQGSRDLWLVVGLFIDFLKSLGDISASRGGPNPLDGMVEEGLDEFTHFD